MEKIWAIILAISIFLAITFLFWKLTSGYAKKEHGSKAWRQWVTRTYYWQTAIFVSSGFTLLIVCFLKWANVLTL